MNRLGIQIRAAHDLFQAQIAIGRSLAVPVRASNLPAPRNVHQGQFAPSGLIEGSIPKKRRLPLASDSQDKVESRFLISKNGHGGVALSFVAGS